MEKYIKVEDTIYGLQNIRKVQIEGIERKAIFYEPKIKSEKTPVVFIFHGHGGAAKRIAGSSPAKVKD